MLGAPFQPIVAKPLYAMLNPNDSGSGVSLSGVNLNYASTVNISWIHNVSRATLGKSSGKWYWENKVTATDASHNLAFGIADATTAADSFTNVIGVDNKSIGALSLNALFVAGAGLTRDYATALPSWALNDIIGIALDMDNGRMYLHQNGTYFNSGNPGAGTGFVVHGMSGAWYPVAQVHETADTLTVNFGQAPFIYAVPSGFNTGVFV